MPMRMTLKQLLLLFVPIIIGIGITFVYDMGALGLRDSFWIEIGLIWVGWLMYQIATHDLVRNSSREDGYEEVPKRIERWGVGSVIGPLLCRIGLGMITGSILQWIL